ncbi:ABC transporter [Hyphomicrobium nitrativorans NL23]|uniref:ABC transporter n=1 Tax=Hyphomicrobium nitrativorans NL23 TaxID=1029756 RepID=V5SCG4_9HYPH|nr:ABC transporter ATP-binding protein [Hyphomicrobium nitrativorans]AHB48213.1 ABC transporter [Hyphomicrobium nitrativorans NL23]
MTRLSVRNLSVDLGGQTIVRDVSLDFAPDGVIGLIGPNGAGKSTFLKAILGLVPSRGGISYDGKPLPEIDRRALARLTSYLPQDREIAWPLSVENVVALGRTPYLSTLSGLGSEDHQEIESAIALTDIAHLRNRIVSTLSGGERARVLMARVLAQATPILIADEPVAALDPGHQIALLETLDALSSAGRTIIVSLHEISLAARWCRRLVLLDKGSIAADGKPEDVLTHEHFAKVYGVRIHRTVTEDGLLVQPVARLPLQR